MRFFILLALTFISINASAADYYWSQSGGDVKYPSATAACDALIASQSSIGAQGSVSIFSESSASCNYRNWYGSYNIMLYRYGDSCPTGQTYNATTSACEGKTNKCEALLGTTNFFSTDVPVYEMCIDGCTAAATDVATYKSKAESKTFYSYQAEYTGEECSSNSTGEVVQKAPDPTTSEKAEDCGPTTTNADGSKTSTCTKTVTDIDNSKCVAGGGSVGSIDGVMGCVAANKGPKATETKTTTKQTTSTDAATGVTTVSKETTTSQTSCSGAATCITNNTTVTNNTKTNSDGTPAGETSTCTGANCGTDGKAAEGDGKEDEKEEEGVDGPTKSLAQGEKGDFTEANTEWDAKVESIKEELSGKIEEYKALFAGKFDLNLGEGGGKLPCDTFPVDIGNYGSTTIRLCPNDYADYLIYLKYALILGASVLAAFVVLKD